MATATSFIIGVSEFTIDGTEMSLSKKMYNICTCKVVISTPFSAGTVFRHQNLKAKVDPRTERIEIFIMVVDPQHRYSNEAETVN